MCSAHGCTEGADIRVFHGLRALGITWNSGAYLIGSLSSATMCSAMAIDAVAAGDGALRIEVTGPAWLTRKSSTSAPFGSTACARTPAGADITSPIVSQGRYVLASAR